MFSRWHECNSSGDTFIPVRDKAWHTFSSKTLSWIAEGAGLISNVSLLWYCELLTALRSSRQTRSGRRELQFWVILSSEWRDSYLSEDSLNLLVSSDNLAVMSSWLTSCSISSSTARSVHKFDQFISSISLARSVLQWPIRGPDGPENSENSFNCLFFLKGIETNVWDSRGSKIQISLLINYILTYTRSRSSQESH